MFASQVVRESSKSESKTVAKETERVRRREMEQAKRHSFVTRLAERPEVSEQTIRSLAGHVSNQMLQHYSHIRSQAKQAGIRALEEQPIQANLPEHGQRNEQSGEQADDAAEANLLKSNGGPAWIRTRDQRIMSPLL